jgi:hypothetical protein
MPHVPGIAYSSQEIDDEYDADPGEPHEIVRVNNWVTALRLRLDLNPIIENEYPQIWVGATPKLVAWGERLGSDTSSVHLYVTQTNGEPYYYKGKFHIMGDTIGHDELRMAMSRRGISEVSRIVYLSGPHSE